MYVVDASIIVKWVLREEGAKQALDLLDHDLAAPSLWLSEAANAIWKRAQRGELSAGEPGEMIADLMSAPIQSEPIAPLADDALRYALLLNHPVYDCFYLSLAVRRGCNVVTADRRFVVAAERERAFMGRVRLLGA